MVDFPNEARLALLPSNIQSLFISYNQSILKKTKEKNKLNCLCWREKESEFACWDGCGQPLTHSFKNNPTKSTQEKEFVDCGMEWREELCLARSLHKEKINLFFNYAIVGYSWMARALSLLSPSIPPFH